MNASKELIEAFEGIGWKRKWIDTGWNEGYWGEPSTQDLQEWLYENHRVFVEIRMHRLEFYPEVYSTNGSRSIIKLAIIELNTYFNTPHEALSDGLMKAVEIVKERKNND